MDNVTVTNVNLKIAISDSHGTSQQLTVTSTFNPNNYSSPVSKKCNQDKTEIKILSNNFGLIDKYRINLVNVFLLRPAMPHPFNAANVVNLELVLNKYENVVSQPLVYLYYNVETEINNIDDTP